MDQSVRERIIDLIRKMREHTVERGCTPAEAGNFAAKVAAYVEKYQIEEAELASKDGSASSPKIDVVHNVLGTGKKVFNPGMTAVVSGLAQGMCCQVILLTGGDEAKYGIVGDQLDADYVVQMATHLVPSLQIMARLEGKEHGEEKAGLVRWINQYLIGAGQEIRLRIERNRKERSEIKEVEHQLALSGVDNATVDANPTSRSPAPPQALVLVTGETIAAQKREIVTKTFKEMYPKTKSTYSRSSYDGTARERGREAGKTVGLNVQIGKP